MFKIKNKSKEIITVLGMMFGPFFLACISFYTGLGLSNGTSKAANNTVSFLENMIPILLLVFYFINIYVAWHYVHQDLKSKNKAPVYRKVLAGISILIVFAGIVALCIFDSSMYD